MSASIGSRNERDETMTDLTNQRPANAIRRVPLSPEDQIEREIEALKGQGVDTLRKVWMRRPKGAPPKIQSADILRRLIAWKIQVEAFGDLDPETKARIRQMMRATGKVEIAPSPSAALKTGTILVREWQGVEHRVLVLDQGFEHESKRYRSLSEVARAIAGTRWSGPRFFGLEASKASPSPSPTPSTTKARLPRT
jgi:hypothetical protein